MRSIASLGGMTVGALIIITSLNRALSLIQGSAATDIYVIMAWSVMAVLGLFVLCWGIMRFMMGGERTTSRAVPPKGHTGAPSPESRTRNR